MTDQTKIKLSAAIRAGIEKRGETNEAYFETPTRHTDSIGAALEGAGVVNPGVMTMAWLDGFGFHEAHDLLVRQWGKEVIEADAPCIADCRYSGELHDLIDHLTDVHRATRADVAAHLERLGY
jgi:hypothetical protein